MLKYLFCRFRSKKSEMELEELIKLILVAIAIIVLGLIIGGVISGKLNLQLDKIFDFLNGF